MPDPTPALSSLSAAELIDFLRARQGDFVAHQAANYIAGTLAESRQAIKGERPEGMDAAVATVHRLNPSDTPESLARAALLLLRQIGKSGHGVGMNGLGVENGKLIKFEDGIGEGIPDQDEADALCLTPPLLWRCMAALAAQQDAVAAAREEERDRCKQILTELRTVIGTYQANLAIEVINRAASHVAEAGSPAEGVQ